MFHAVMVVAARANQCKGRWRQGRTMDSGQEKRHLIGPDQAGQRLDKALASFLPDSGLRLRRRLIETGRVLLDGRAAAPGARVHAGQEICLLPMPEPDAPLPRLVHVHSGLAAVLKPVGVHSARVAGGGPSLEERLAELFPGREPALLNRLDQGTGGLLLVALDESARREYQAREAAGEVDKTYLAVVRGRVEQGFTVRRALDVKNRKKTRVLGADDPDPARWTVVEPVVEPLENIGGDTLVRARIKRGARHQIRAHLAWAGHPLAGDALYGGGEGGFRLHHLRVELPGFAAEAGPDWKR